MSPGESLMIGPNALPTRVPASTIEQVIGMNDTMDGQGRILVFFDGHVDESRMERAVRLSITAQPLLGYRYVDHWRRPYWQRTEESEWEDVFQLVADDTERRLHDFMVEPVPPERSPQIRAGLFRGKDDVLCIRTNHLAIDGGGAVHYLRTLSSTYRDIDRDRGLSNTTRIVRTGPRDVLREAGLLNAVKALPKLRPPDSSWGIEAVRPDLEKHSFIIKRLEEESVLRIRAYAKESKVTMNDVLLAAYCRALFETCDPPFDRPLRIEVPTSLRRYLPEDGNNVTGNLASVYFLTMERRKEEKFGETVQKVHERMVKQKSDGIDIGEILLLELLLWPGKGILIKLQNMVGFEIAHPVLSNLGIIDEEAANFGDVRVKDVQFIGPTLYPPNIGMGASTFRDIMTLNINFCSSAVDPLIMERLMERMLEQLPR